MSDIVDKINETVDVLFKKQNKNIKNKNKDFFKHLEQGKSHIKLKQSKINKLVKNLDVMESKNIKEGVDIKVSLSEKEKQQLEAQRRRVVLDHNTFNDRVKDYADKSEQFYMNYEKLLENSNKCKKWCNEQDEYRGNANKTKHDACVLGCAIYNPVVKTCKDTWEGSGSCINNTYDNGIDLCNLSDPTVSDKLTSKEKSDYLNKLNKRGPANTPSIKDGCCRCGGGDPNGNKPSHIVDGKKHTSCDTLSGDLKQICNSAYPNSVGYEYLNMARNFKSNAKDLEVINKNLQVSISNLSHKIRDVRNGNSNIRRSIQESRNNINNKLREFEEKYPEYEEKMNSDNNPYDNDSTLNAMKHDIKLKRDSERLRVGIWGGLAVVSLITIAGLAKRIKN